MDFLLKPPVVYRSSLSKKEIEQRLKQVLSLNETTTRLEWLFKKRVVEKVRANKISIELKYRVRTVAQANLTITEHDSYTEIAADYLETTTGFKLGLFTFIGIVLYILSAPLLVIPALFLLGAISTVIINLINAQHNLALQNFIKENLLD